MRLELTLSGPLAKMGDTTLATLDGLTSGAKLELGWTIFGGTIADHSFEESPLIAAARVRCRAENPPYQPGCTRIDNAFKDKFLRPDERLEYDRSFAQLSIQRNWAFGLHGAVGYDQFAYYTGVDLTKQTVDRFSWNVGTSLTLFPRLFPASTSALIFGADYQRDFAAARTQTACPITVVPAVVRCVTGALDPPNLEEKVIFSAEYRQLIRLSPTGMIRSLGIAPRIEFDALSDDFSIDVPIYLAPNDKGRLIGGVRIGYTSREDEIVAGLFIGTTFGIFE